MLPIITFLPLFEIITHYIQEKDIVYSLKMYCFDDSIDCTLCQQSYFVQNRIV